MLRSGNESQRSVWDGWAAKVGWVQCRLSGFVTDCITYIIRFCLDLPRRRLAEKPRMPKRLECLTENVMRQPDSLTDRQPDKNALRQSDKDKFLTQVGKICRILSTSTMGSACLRPLQFSDGKSGSPHPSVRPGRVCIKMTRDRQCRVKRLS